MWGLVRCLWTLSSWASCLRLALLALTGDDNPMYECMQAEARVLNLGRTSWHYDGGRRAAAARPPQSRWGARVSKRVAGRAMPDFSKTSPAPRVPAVPPREPPLEPRPAGTVPECVPPWLATRTRRGQSSRRERVARRRRMRRGGCGYKAPLRRSEVGRRPSRVRSDMPHAPRKRGW